MNKRSNVLCGLLLSAVAGFSLVSETQALNYTNADLDMMLCFRKAGAPNPNDLEVNIGSVLGYLALPPGATTNISQFDVGQLTRAIGSATFENVGFSVSASAHDGIPTNYSIAPKTVWATLQRTDPSVQSTPYARSVLALLGQAATQVQTLGNEARIYSAAQSVSADNTTTAVAVPPGDTTDSCEKYLGTTGNLNKTYTTSIENHAPATFTSAIRSDLYENVPTGSPDPLNGNQTSGNVSYIGYFDFSPSGTVSFTRASLLPAAPTLTLTRSGDVNTISFFAAGSATYSLFYTNSAGLSQATATWPSLSTNITGNGAISSFIDTSADPNRFYRVQAH